MCNLASDITIILRSVGERTEKVCYDILSQEVPESNIVVIRNLPLKESTVELCKEALIHGRKYVITIGADYIPERGMVRAMWNLAESMAGNWMFVKGVIDDKFMMELRGDSGGPMLYPLEILRGWSEILPTIDNEVTTEASCQKHYREKGYRELRSKILLAKHDYEQHYHDIYRCMFVYGKKHRKIERILDRWGQLALYDKDFEVAYYAYKKGRAYKGEVKADFREDYGFKDSPFKDWVKDDYHG